MLDRVAISDERFDLGSLAEAIVYYGHVELVVTSGSFIEIIKLIGIDDTIRLAESEFFTFVYNRSFPSVHSDSGRFHPHIFSAISIHRSAEGVRLNSPEREITSTLDRNFGKGVIPRAKIRRICNALRVREAAGEAIMQGALNDALDGNLLSALMRALMESLVPDYPKKNTILSKINIDGKYFQFDSNIDFNLANDLYSRHVPPSHSSITPAFLLAHVASMRWEMFYSGDQLCDVWATPAQSAILRVKVNSFSEKIGRSRESIDRFEDVVFSGRSFREAANSGKLEISDILDFVDRAETRRFKDWIKTSPPKADLLREYDKANAAASSFMRSLPARTAKFVAFSVGGALLDKVVGGSGVVGAMSGIAADWTLNTADEMLSSQLKMGWKPNQWVTNSAAPRLIPK